MNNHRAYKEDLLRRGTIAQFRAATEFVVCDQHFYEQSASCHERAHHYGKHGLLKHTWEVVKNCQTIASLYHDKSINLDVLFLAALYHDYGKLWDYDYDPKTNSYIATKHKRVIHHISRSAIEWNKVAHRFTADESIIDAVTHCILSHHGQRQFGSPVAPLTREAYILHYCDSLSARIDDCDRIDLIELPKT